MTGTWDGEQLNAHKEGGAPTFAGFSCSFERTFTIGSMYFSITIPPLSARREDIPLLVEYFMRKHSSLCGYPELRGKPCNC